jgi:hypothetical protein
VGFIDVLANIMWGYWVFIGVCLEYRVAAVGVMVGDHHTTQDREDMVAGCGSVTSMTVEVPIPSVLFPLGLGSPVYETA